MQGAIGVGLRVVGIEADRLVEIGQRLFLRCPAPPSTEPRML